MRDTWPPGCRAARRGSLLLALLAATAALSAGVQAIAPAPAAAMINEGEECGDPFYPSIDCETINGGGGGSTGGGETGGGGIVGGEAGGGETVGEETIEIESNAPSPCVIQPSRCLPTQSGGTQRPGRDGGRSARAPRPRGRPTRVAQAPKGKAKTPTKGECERLRANLLELPADLKMKAIEASLASVNDRQTSQEEKLRQLQENAERLAREVMSLQNGQAPSKTVLAAQERYQRAMGSIAAMERELKATMEEFFRLAKEHEAWRGKRDAEVRILLKRCAAAYGIT